MRPLPPGTTFGIVSDSFHRAIPSSPNSEFSISGKDGTGHLSARQESELEGARLGVRGTPCSVDARGRSGGCDDSVAATTSDTSPPKLDPTSASFRYLFERMR